MTRKLSSLEEHISSTTFSTRNPTQTALGLELATLEPTSVWHTIDLHKIQAKTCMPVNCTLNVKYLVVNVTVHLTMYLPSTTVMFHK